MPVRKATAFILCAVSVAFTSCSRRNAPIELSTVPIVIWTDKVEIASYVELFNASQDKYKAVVEYHSNPCESLDLYGTVNADSSSNPDIVIGTALKNSHTRSYFLPLDYLFTERSLDETRFYPSLLSAGKQDDKQYILPLSFNMPAVMFSTKYESLIEENYMLSVDQIKEIASSFNSVNSAGKITAMGFAPSWDGEFLYLVSLLAGASYRQEETMFSWDNTQVNNAVEYLRDWTTTANGSTTTEQEFSFKYLYTPKYKQIATGRCLFSYISSGDLFNLNGEILQNIDFRWIHQNHKIPIADSLVSLGIFKRSKNTDAAESFIVWLLQENTQKSLLERTKKMNLNNAVFGIAGGFSAMKDVTEKDFPMYYQLLLGNLPVSEYLDSVTILPPQWNTIKQKVIIPYLMEVTDTSKNSNETLGEALANWKKQNY